MASALLPQCARPLLVVVAALLLCCCRPVEAQWDFNYFNCARTGAKLRGGLTIPMDNQLRINSWQLGRAERDEVAQLGLLMNTKDELKLTMVGGASCSSVFSKANVNGATCVLGKTTKVVSVLGCLFCFSTESALASEP
uniref:G8 domain-containing protein n=1 Tax=Globodera pallida TaxID=36090 RepID=A0A183CQS7_GLOPA